MIPSLDLRIEQAIEQIWNGGYSIGNARSHSHRAQLKSDLRTILTNLVEAEVRQAVSGNKRAWEIGRQDTLKLVDTIMADASDPTDLFTRLLALVEHQA